MVILNRTVASLSRNLLDWQPRVVSPRGNRQLGPLIIIGSEKKLHRYLRATLLTAVRCDQLVKLKQLINVGLVSNSFQCNGHSAQGDLPAIQQKKTKSKTS